MWQCMIIGFVQLSRLEVQKDNQAPTHPLLFLFKHISTFLLTICYYGGMEWASVLACSRVTQKILSRESEIVLLGVAHAPGIWRLSTANNVTYQKCISHIHTLVFPFVTEQAPAGMSAEYWHRRKYNEQLTNELLTSAGKNVCCLYINTSKMRGHSNRFMHLSDARTHGIEASLLQSQGHELTELPHIFWYRKSVFWRN